MTNLLLIIDLLIRAGKQLIDTFAGRVNMSPRYQVRSDIIYLTVNDDRLKLDLYQCLSDRPSPIVIWIHPGGWIDGQKEREISSFWPFLELGYSVANIEYRLARQSLAPAAVDDCLAALNWVRENANLYGFNPDRIVVAGRSAGGHLALMVGMLSANARREGYGVPLGQNFSENVGEQCKVAAIVNISGITDVRDLLHGENVRDYAVTWMGSQPNSGEISQQVSPIHYVCAELPPILTIHGDADTIVPYSHAVQLHQALDRCEVSNQLLTIPGGKHRFSWLEKVTIYNTIQEFVREHNMG